MTHGQKNIKKCKGKGQAISVQAVHVAASWGSHIWEQSAHEGLNNPGNIPFTHIPLVRQESFSQLQISVTPSRIKRVQCLTQLRHRLPWNILYLTWIVRSFVNALLFMINAVCSKSITVDNQCIKLEISHSANCNASVITHR